MTRPIDLQRLDDAADAQLLEIALGALSLARQIETLARARARSGTPAERLDAEEPALLACLGLLSVARTLDHTLSAAESAPASPPAEPPRASPRATGLLR